MGTPAQLQNFHALVPAPNEAYTQLFWQRDTKRIDSYIQKRRKDMKSKGQERQQELPLEP